MGRKGVSKRKSKKSKPLSNADKGGSSHARSGEASIVQTLVHDKGTLLKKGGLNPAGGSNKTIKKR